MEFKTHLLLCGALLTLTNGCLNYQRPPLAVESSSYTALQQDEKNLLPENLTSLTLAEAQELALKNNPDFNSIKFSIDSARARYYQQFSSYAPTLNAGMSIEPETVLHGINRSLYSVLKFDFSIS